MSKKGKNNPEKDQKTTKKLEFDKKKLSIFIILVIVIVIGVTAYLLLNNNDKYKLIDPETTISILEDGSYYMFGVRNNQAFEVETNENFSYKVTDEKTKKLQLLQQRKIIK